MPEAPRFGWRVLLVSTVLAAIAAAASYLILDGGSGGDGVSPGETADGTITVPLQPDEAEDPDTVTFTEFDGTEVALSSLRGGPVLVNFFASTCVPCITEMPAFEEVHQEVGDQITFLGLAVADRRDAALDLVEQIGVTYRTAQDRNASVITALEGQILPTTVLLDAEGRIVGSHAGELDADDLRDWLADAMGINA